MATYEEKQQERSTRKILLAKISATKRLIAWVVHSGPIYKLTGFDISVISSVEESGVALVAVGSLGSVTVGTYFHDSENNILYAHVTGGGDPNGSFIGLTFFNFFSNSGVILPNDLATGFDVYWLPLIKTTSKFGVELDNEDQIGLAIEGAGSISFENDRTYWESRYEKLTWEQQDCLILSTFSGLPGSEAKIIYNGKIAKKAFNSSTVKFDLKDLLSELRGELPLTELTGKIPPSLQRAKARRVYGRKFGLRATNVDQVLTGYPLTGTITATKDSDVVTGVGTLFFKELSPDDIIVIGGTESTIEDITSDTNIKLTEVFGGVTTSGANHFVTPNISKPYINRKFKLAGHVLREPKTTVVSSKSSTRIEVASVADLIEGDGLFIGALGSGENVTIDRLLPGNVIKITTALATAPTPGTEVLRPSAQNVRINATKLIFDQDYSVNADLAELTIKEIAEFNRSEIRSVNGTMSMTNGSKIVTGTNTSFQSQLKPGYHIRVKGNFDFFEIMAIDSDTSLRLRVNATITDSGTSQYKPVSNFKEGDDFLSCDIIGTTVNGLKTGALVEKGADIVKHLLGEINLTSLIDTTSFTKAALISEQKLGLVIPEKFDDTTTSKVRDLINQVNQTVLGSLVQNEDFKLEYNILNPATPQVTTFKELDIINFSVVTENDRIVKTAIVRYLKREHDFDSGTDSFQTKQKTSDIGSFLVKTNRTKTIETLFVFEDDARIYANRWSFLLELGSNVIKMATKMQGSRLQVNDIIELFHRKLYERVGGGKRRLGAIQKIEKNHQDVDIETEDLSNSFNRVGIITENSIPNFDNSTDDQKFLNSYITDSFGMINNSEDTHSLNLIW